MEVDISEARATFETNFIAVIRMCKTFLSLLMKANGTIVQIGSVAGVIPYVFGSVYNASKAALHSFSDSLRVELAPFGVNVTTVITGGVQSRIARVERTLVPNSLYAPIEDEYNRRVTHSQDGAMPHAAYARSVVAQVLYGPAPWRWLWPWAKGRKSWIWEGNKSWLVWFLTGGWAWTGLFQRIMVRMFKLNKLHKKFARGRPIAAAFRAATGTSVPSRLGGQQRNLSIHEYLSANLLKSYGIGMPKGEVARTAEEAEAVAKSLGNDDMVIKAQVLAGGRGKGTFDNGLKGGVRVIYSPTEAKMFASQMIGRKLITKQTGAAGRLCNSVYICERKFARREFYLAVLMDRQSQSPVIVASSQGGMDIEAVAKESPEAIITTPIDINVGVTDAIANKIATELGFSEQCIPEAKETIQKLYKVFIEKDATQIEINPLSETSDHQVMAMDAKLGFDDNAEFRQKEVFSWRDTTQEDLDEVKAAEHGLNFIKLDGDIGCLVNGAGLAMATMDIIKLNGGSPANFLDVGGGATPAAIKSAFELITSDPKVSAIFVNIFGGIVRCDAIAQGLINVVQEMGLRTPIVARLQGTNMEQAHKLINESGLKIFSMEDLQNAAEKSVQFSKVVKMAREIDVGVEFTLGI
ncbi:Succinate--CoA ligase [ADP-forming] subunit beta, mitochondrial [Aspergillus tanneri]|uniref:Succinate--CoA ligase [ADP-forming] subunit beta, mitochondrial n=1 Tax=Aspergillus tanneri TaxID=1220188 RepID=A0A5M9MYU2_9EURO|nr:Succinate--CoA ligase [ADP-forming] subunit beta, mitochondrial [Aspergillus tanneri]KAA8650053.1 Succinate--CoA ligase [ADP-forming] subunit beta, mitochondrial [Aspergillus tanneri]